MEFFELSIKSHTLHGVKWPVKKPKAIVILMHGLGEYAQRYDTTCRFYNQNKISVYGFDLFGHGDSDGVRGHIGGREDIFCAIDMIINYAQTDFFNSRSTPVFMYGHSLGGNLCLSYRINDPNPMVKGYIISAPWIELAHNPKMFQLAGAKLLSLVSPSFRYNYARSFTGQKEVLGVGEDYIRDTAIHPFISAKTAMDAINSGKCILKNAQKSKVPIFIFHGSDDTVCSSKGSKMLIENTTAFCKFIDIPGTGHECMHTFSYMAILEESCIFIDEVMKLSDG